MEDADLVLQILAGSFFTVGICVLGYCIRRSRKPVMKQSSSMENLNAIVSEDPQS